MGLWGAGQPLVGVPPGLRAEGATPSSGSAWSSKSSPVAQAQGPGALDSSPGCSTRTSGDPNLPLFLSGLVLLSCPPGP